MQNYRHNNTLAVPVSSRDHVQGPADAAVTLVEYGDFECPYSGLAFSVIKEFQQSIGDNLRFVYRNFPLADIHPFSLHAAIAAEVASQEGKFWEMYDLLFENQDALGDRSLAGHAAQLGIHPDHFSRCMSEHQYAGRVEEDRASGQQSGVHGTPTFFINGERYTGDTDAALLLNAIEKALQA